MALQVADNVRTRRGHAAAGFAGPHEAGAHEGFRDSFPAESGRDEGVGEDRVFIVGGILENGFAVIGGDEEAAGVGVVGDVHRERFPRFFDESTEWLISSLIGGKHDQWSKGAVWDIEELYLAVRMASRTLTA